MSTVAGVVYRPGLLLLPLLLVLGRVHDGMEMRRQRRDNGKLKRGGGLGWWLGWWRVKSTYKRSDRRAIVGSGGFTMYKRAGDSSLATISASSPVLREKKRDSNQHWFTVGGAFGASDAARAGPLPSVPVARTRAPACLRLGGDLMFSLTVDSSCKAQQARYRLRRALVGLQGPDAIFGKLCGWAGSMNSPYSIAAMRPVN